MIRSVLIVVILALLAGCSAVKLGYNSAEKLLAYRLDDWFDLPDAMREPARERLHRVLAWHRREELPRYAQLLREAERRLEEPRPLQASELLSLQERVMAHLLELGKRAADEFADVLVQFGPAQRRRLLARLDELDEEFREEYVEAPAAEVRRRRIELMIDRYEFWLGRLSRGQRALVEQWVDAHPSDAAWRLQLRQARQRAFLGILEDAAQRQSPEQLAARLRAFLADVHTPGEAQARARQEKWEHARAQLTAELFNAATLAQRERARERLRRLAEDFLDLSRQRGAR
ncbi:DUF6279 family lipoprotein [uncultured Pigmentiphaga sp.]|uniref:DUF6279 family lipoprotein n=1 Tax=uncultured Pigmentiphaga sp. TaxID=340361 RepID=UPI0026223DFD|nr:DUF6279 family lipoprotein [uncultured Pigmentiphaga sp.]